MQFYGVEYTVDVLKIRCRMVALDGAQAQPSLRGTTGIAGWASRMGVSHMTLFRLFRGNPITLQSMNRILAGLDLSFGEVCNHVGATASVA